MVNALACLAPDFAVAIVHTEAVTSVGPDANRSDAGDEIIVVLGVVEDIRHVHCPDGRKVEGGGGAVAFNSDGLPELCECVRDERC